MSGNCGKLFSEGKEVVDYIYAFCEEINFFSRYKITIKCLRNNAQNTVHIFCKICEKSKETPIFKCVYNLSESTDMAKISTLLSIIVLQFGTL